MIITSTIEYVKYHCFYLDLFITIMSMKGGITMINDNIKRLRKAKKMSQEEMAVHLNVVKQTISKYESGISVPDADMVIKMSELLDVSVSEILGVEIKETQVEDLSKELARLNEELAKKSQKEHMRLQIGKVRGIILLITFMALICSYSIKNPIISIGITGLCMLSCVIILYRNLTLLTKDTTQNMKLHTLKTVTIINGLLLLVCILFVILSELGYITLTENEGKYLAFAFIAIIIIYSGIIATRLPFTRHTGLRLPWTVADEDTWNVAHRVLSIVAIPLAIFYFIGIGLFTNFETLTLVIVILWIGIPALVSLLFYYKKFHG